MANRTITVPASTTNLGPGYDALGLALQLYLRVEVEDVGDSAPSMLFSGEGAGEVPLGAENLIDKVMRRVFVGERRRLPNVCCRVSNDIPLARGLGSSGAAIVAGIACYEAVTGDELEPERFFNYAVEFESAPDNVTAARYGGFTITCVDEQQRVTFFRAPLELSAKIILTVPEFQLATERARAVLPHDLSLPAAIFNIQRSSLMVAALLTNETRLLREALRDMIHQSHRLPLVPGLDDVLRLDGDDVPGLIGSCLSGAGPSILTFADANFDEVSRRIGETLTRRGVRSRSYQLAVENTGRMIS